MSVTKDGDYLPHTLTTARWAIRDGSIRSGLAHIQSLWTIRPDGTGPTRSSNSISTTPGRGGLPLDPGATAWWAWRRPSHAAGGPVILINPATG